MTPTRVAGIDSSTQKTKLIVVDVKTGSMAHSSALPHPDGTEVDPRVWWEALHGAGGAHPVATQALSIAAQQHTTIFLDADGTSLRPAILWNDLRATQAAADLRQERTDWLDTVGFVPAAAHPVSKLRWLAEHEPKVAARVNAVMLPHDWLTWNVLRRRSAPTTDRSDASATGYWSPTTGTYHPELLAHALGRQIADSVLVPRVAAPDATVGVTDAGLIVAAGCGDNAATHLGLDTAVGDMVISIGTSATVSMRTDLPTADPTGFIDTMADARSGFLAIVAMLNGARVLTSTARMLGVGLDRFDALATAGAADAQGALMIPYLDGERNPAAEFSTGALIGLSRRALTPESMARAAVLGLGCAIAEAVSAVQAVHGAPRRVLLVGGGARSQSVRQVLADLLGVTVVSPPNREHAAYGAARQAAAALTGEFPQWGPLAVRTCEPQESRGWVDEVRERYRRASA